MTASWTHSSVWLTVSAETQPVQPTPLFVSGWFWLSEDGFCLPTVSTVLPAYQLFASVELNGCYGCSSTGWQHGFIIPHFHLPGLSQLGSIMHILSKHWPASQQCHKQNHQLSRKEGKNNYICKRIITGSKLVYEILNSIYIWFTLFGVFVWVLTSSETIIICQNWIHTHTHTRNTKYTQV